MSKKITFPRGTSDILPQEALLWQKLEQESRTLLGLYGYKEIRTPFFEETDLFARSIGQTSDIVQKQILNLASQRLDDKGNIKLSGLSLRPEGTASVVRSYIQNGFDRQENLSKLFYIGPMFRGERPQKGRLRQFHQIGVEAIGPGAGSPYLDAEVIALSVNLLNSFGLNGFRLKINTLGSNEDKKNFSKYLREQLNPLINDLCGDCQSRFERNVFRILDCKSKECKTIVSKIDLTTGAYLSSESQEYFVKVKAALDDLGVDYIEDPKLVRGLDYYTHTVFEISDASLGSQDALGAGGRYNNLVTQLGGPKVDAVGFALGVERIMLAMPEIQQEEHPTIDVYLIAGDEKFLPRTFKILNTLRENKFSSSMGYKFASIKNQMKVANKIGARFVMILGEKEYNNKTASLKNMSTGEQREISENEYIKVMKEL
ncbi:MAG: histidine--tRNA ligase [Candidatus Omnitrophica bacterium]|nr:histidine--tRNA ligase [Candidatus Omnitrophota bacterium]